MSTPRKRDQRRYYSTGVYIAGYCDYFGAHYCSNEIRPPKIVAIARSPDAAEAWIAEDYVRQRLAVELAPRSGQHQMLDTIDLDDPLCYGGIRRVAEGPLPIAALRRLLIADPGIIRID